MAKHIEYKPGGRQLFLTLAAYQRANVLTEHVNVINESWKLIEREHGMELICWVVLPNHTHLVLDTNFNPISTLTHSFKLATAKLFHAAKVTGRTALWESQYWSQPMESQRDLERHVDFVHYNPVKHGLAVRPWDYQHSSFREFVKHGYYFKEWTLDADRRRELRQIDSGEVDNQPGVD